MSIFKRAFLYVIRKWGKTILLFAILLIMATFVLTGLSIWKASEAAQLNLRQSLGGKFEIYVDWENSPYVVKETVKDNEFDEETGKSTYSFLIYLLSNAFNYMSFTYPFCGAEGQTLGFWHARQALWCGTLLQLTIKLMIIRA